MNETRNIVEQLRDLNLQTTTERSHYYVASRNAIAEIERLRAENAKLREAVDFAVMWVEGMPYAGKITDDRIASADDVAAFLSAIRASTKQCGEM